MSYLERSESQSRLAKVREILEAQRLDVSLFGHPEFSGVRIETGYRIGDKGPIPFSPKMDKVLT